MRRRKPNRRKYARSKRRSRKFGMRGGIRLA